MRYNYYCAAGRGLFATTHGVPWRCRGVCGGRRGGRVRLNGEQAEELCKVPGGHGNAGVGEGVPHVGAAWTTSCHVSTAHGSCRNTQPVKVEALCIKCTATAVVVLTQCC